MKGNKNIERMPRKILSTDLYVAVLWACPRYAMGEKMKRILVVDDASFMRLAIKTLLENNGFTVEGEASNGMEAIEKYKLLKPDVVTLDITMPEMTGLDALKEIISYDPKAKVIMVSAMGQENMIREAIMYGAKTFIVKPYKDDHVIKTIKKVLDA